jgi:hypothetical protein
MVGRLIYAKLVTVRNQELILETGKSCISSEQNSEVRVASFVTGDVSFV